MADAVKVSSFGFDPVDSTRFLQAALDSKHPEIVVDRMPSPWVVPPLAGRSAKRILLAAGVEIVPESGTLVGTGAHLLDFTSCTNVSIIGRGAKIRMWKEDYLKPPYAKSEYRHALVFESCETWSAPTTTGRASA